jgi:hypothetical protein
MSGTPISSDEIKAIVAGRKAGKSYRTIASELGRSTSAIQRLAGRLGMHVRDKASGAVLSDERQEQARKLVEEGYSFTAAARVVRCDPKTVAKIARKAGFLPTRKFGGPQDMSRTLRARIEALAGCTATNARIAELLDCTVAEVEAVRAARRREAKDRARKAYQQRVTMPGYEEDRLGQVLASHPRPRPTPTALLLAEHRSDLRRRAA